MYESPIRMIESASNHVVEKIENELVVTVTRTVGFDVDKEEILKALKYDREQYDKGYADGVRDATWRWIPTSERLPTAKDADEKGNIIGRIPNGAVWMVWYKTVCSEPDMFSHWARMPELPEE